MTPVSNMGPFGLASLKGNGDVNAVPSFRNQLPITIGGIAAKDIPFGVVVSSDPANPTHFYPGLPQDTYVVRGISMMDPTIMTNDPGMNDRYFASRPMTACIFGILQYVKYDLGDEDCTAPAINRVVMFNKTTGEIAFSESGTPPTGYVALNAHVTDVHLPNGADVFFQIPILSTGTKQTTNVKTGAITADPAAGAVDAGTVVHMVSATPGARIFYTLDGTKPGFTSNVYDDTLGVPINAAVTINAIAVAENCDPSDLFTAAYTLN